MEYVKDIEVKALNGLFHETYNSVNQPLPKFLFITVSKRIHTRLFNATRPASNPAPGTVVDTTITLPER